MEPCLSRRLTLPVFWQILHPMSRKACASRERVLRLLLYYVLLCIIWKLRSRPRSDRRRNKRLYLRRVCGVVRVPAGSGGRRTKMSTTQRILFGTPAMQSFRRTFTGIVALKIRRNCTFRCASLYDSNYERKSPPVHFCQRFQVVYPSLASHLLVFKKLKFDYLTIQIQVTQVLDLTFYCAHTH